MRLRMFMYVTIICCWGKTLSIPQHVKKEIKEKILPLLGMTEPPKLTEPTIVPEMLQEVYESVTNMEFDTASLPLPGLFTQSANTVRSFVHVEGPVDEKFITPHKFRLKFDVSSIPKEETLKSAEVRLTREALNGTHTKYRLLVHDILRRGNKNNSPIMRVIDSKIIDTRENNTISVDVSPAVQRWLADPKSNYGVLIALHQSSKNVSQKTKYQRHLKLKRDTESKEKWWQDRPLLFTYTDDGKNQQMTKDDMTKLRPKRAAKKPKKMEKDPCKRRTMMVDFQDVGWNDWIVAPPGYDAFYCAGECNYPMPEHFNTTNHAIVQSLVNSAKPTEVPKPCCVPTELSAISMLYVGSDSRVILKNYKDMMVVGCGCR